MTEEEVADREEVVDRKKWKEPTEEEVVEKATEEPTEEEVVEKDRDGANDHQ